MHKWLLASTIFTAPIVTHAATLFVSPTGSDAGNGSQTSPFQTIAAASKVAQPGTTVMVAPGTYAGGFETSASGTAAAPINYVSQVPNSAVIVGTGVAGNANHAGWENEGNYVNISGFNIDGSGAQAASWAFGLYNGASNVTVQGNTVHDIMTDPSAYANLTSAGNGGAGIMMDSFYGASHGDVLGNQIYNIGPTNTTSTLVHGIYQTEPGMVENNVVHNIVGDGITSWHNATDISFINNTVSSVGGTGVLVGSNGTGTGNNFVVNDNTITNAANGIYEEGVTGTNNTYNNNHLSNISGTPVHLQNGLTAQGTTVANPGSAATPATTAQANAITPARVGTGPGQSAPLATPPATSACTAAAPNFAAKNGGFGVIDGKIYSPGGDVFVQRGINAGPQDMAALERSVTTLFRGINFIRLATWYTADYSIADYQKFADAMAAKGIVTEFEDHAYPSPDAYTGSQLAQESAWFGSLAAALRTNPYAWFGSMNEPSGSGAAITAQEVATYNAIRSAGNNSPIMMQAGLGGGVPGAIGSSYLNASAYSSMTNIIWDLHFYGWVVPGKSSDPAAVNGALASGIAATQTITSADGKIPVAIAEFGDSTDGSSVDPNGTQVIKAVLNSGAGYAAWQWTSGGNADVLTKGGQLTAMGQQVAAGIATNMNRGCAESPIPLPIVSRALTDAQNAITAADNLSVADVADLAAQGLTAAGQDIGSVAQLASTGPDPGGTLATDPTTAAVLAEGPAPIVPAVVRTVASPSGTMPTPAPVSTSTTFMAADDYQTVVPAPGNATGTVSGTGNTIEATGGIQTISVTGPGNTITTGPYNDTITVQSGGNTINGGGGNDTVVLAYPQEKPNLGINADLPALPLASAGNIFVAPAPGTGTLTIQGTIARSDRVDLTKALAGSLWDGRAATMLNYVGLASGPTGCTITVNGQVVVKLPNGSPSANITPFLTASGA